MDCVLGSSFIGSFGRRATLEDWIVFIVVE